MNVWRKERTIIAKPFYAVCIPQLYTIGLLCSHTFCLFCLDRVFVISLYHSSQCMVMK